MTLLQLRQFRQDHPQRAERLSVLTEVLDIRDVKLAQVAGAEDFIVSERITALMLAQLAEVPTARRSSPTCSRPGAQRCACGRSRTTPTPSPARRTGAYVAAAHRRGHLPIGFRSYGARGKALATTIHLDPPKSLPVDLKPDDRLIVVASRGSDPALAAVTTTAQQYEGTAAG